MIRDRRSGGAGGRDLHPDQALDHYGRSSRAAPSPGRVHILDVDTTVVRSCPWSGHVDLGRLRSAERASELISKRPSDGHWVWVQRDHRQVRGTRR
jgi:hypothetical protein